MVTISFGNRNFIQPLGRLSMHSKCLDFFSFKFWVGEKVFFFIFLCSQHVSFKFPMGSHQVLNMFPMFPIAPCVNPICSAQSPPLLTYRGEPKGRSICLAVESSILRSFHRFKFLFAMGQINWLPVKK